MKDDVKMEVKDGVKKMVRDAGKTLKGVAEEMGFATVSGLTNKFSRDDLKMGFVCEIAERCGYEVVLRAKDEDNRSIVLMGND